LKNICMTWLDSFDLKRFAGDAKSSGTLIAFIKSEYFAGIDELHLLVPKIKEYSDINERFINAVRAKYFRKKELTVHEFDIKPFVFASIFGSVMSVIRKVEKKEKKGINWHFQVGSGTAQMNAIWVVLSKTNYPAVLYMTSYTKEADNFKTKKYEHEGAIDSDTFDYLMKSVDAKLLKAWADIPEYESIIHKSAVMGEILNNAYMIAAHDVPILILGETGTGKELFAQAIHKSSRRSEKPMKTINCAVIHENTADATLFGWSKGAWTGSVGEGKGLFLECDGGTIFLDEIGDLSLEIQTKLLRVLQQGEVQRVGDGKVGRPDVRIIAATNKDLRKLVIDGNFREDLFYRINVGMFKLPALRDRGGDAMLIAEHFLEKINSQNAGIISKYIPKKLSKQALKFIGGYSWPGNIRELYHTIQRACVWHHGETIDDTDFKNFITEPLGEQGRETASLIPGQTIDLEVLTNDFRKKYILKALDLCGGSKVKAAEMLGYKNYQNLSNEMKRLKM